MALIDLWKNSKSEVENKYIPQIIGFAGEGKLKDNSDAQVEFQEFLQHVSSSHISNYAAYCLTNKFEGNGFALQDIMNEIGRRLGYEVENGRYRGVQGEIGFDGIWKSGKGHTIVVEVKMTDTYMINLDVVSGYRSKLIQDGELTDKSSILFVVGREDTGGLEAQIRGSRHAWDIRIISVDSLVRLMDLAQKLEDPKILEKTTEILIPNEYTRVDGIIELVFSTAEDAEGIDGEKEAPTSQDETVKTATIPAKFHDQCLTKIEEALNTSLIKNSRAIYKSPTDEVTVVLKVSKEYATGANLTYWYGVYPHQSEILKAANKGYFCFGCGSSENIIMIPYEEFMKYVDGMNITRLEDDKSYWHVFFVKKENNFVLQRKKDVEDVDVTRFVL